MKPIFFALILLSVPLTGFGACSGSTSGKSATIGLVISDGGCLYDKDHITFWNYKSDGTPSEEGEKHFPFDEECKEIKNGFVCRTTGRTPLAGTTYNQVRRGKYGCDETGKTAGYAYKCVKGCGKIDVPKYLDIEPYEC
jgi:hypothetical protein